MKLIHRSNRGDDYFNYLPEKEVITINGQRVIAQKKEPKPLCEIKTTLKERVTALRYEVMSSDITIDDVTIKADAESVSRINTLINNARLSDVAQVDFKAVNGWHLMTTEQLERAIKAIAERTQKCFSAEHRCHSDIDQLRNFESLQSYDWRLNFYQLIEE